MTMKTTDPETSSTPNPMAGGYFAIQSILGLVWWIGITRSTTFAEMFFAAESMSWTRQTFALADVSCFVILSAIVAFACWRGARIAYPLVYCLFGAVTYATLCCVSLAINGGPWLSVVVMIASLTGTAWFSTQVRLVTPKHN